MCVQGSEEKRKFKKNQLRFAGHCAVLCWDDDGSVWDVGEKGRIKHAYSHKTLAALSHVDFQELDSARVHCRSICILLILNSISHRATFLFNSLENFLSFFAYFRFFGNQFKGQDKKFLAAQCSHISALFINSILVFLSRSTRDLILMLMSS